MLALARVFLKAATILVLDETTANLDAVTERARFYRIGRQKENRFVVEPEHRLIVSASPSQ